MAQQKMQSTKYEKFGGFVEEKMKDNYENRKM